MSHQQSFNYIGTVLPGLNQYQARINVSCSRTQCSDAGEARTRSPSVSSQALPLSHCAPLNYINKHLLYMYEFNLISATVLEKISEKLKIIFSSISFNICFVCSKESSHSDSSFARKRTVSACKRTVSLRRFV